MSNKIKISIFALSLAFLAISGTAFATLTFNTNTITGSGAIDLTPVGAPVTINGDLTVTGTCTGCSGGSGAPTTATYITQTADATLSNEQALGSLGTGLLKNTTTTGVLSIAVANTDYLAAAAINLASSGVGGVTGDLPFTNLAQASSASKLLGRGDSGAGDFQEITLGSGLTMTGTTLSVSGSGAPTDATYWTGSANGTLSNELNLGALSTGLVLNTAGTPSAYAGTSCTNQFVRSLNGSGAATCASVNLASDVTGTLPKANGGSLVVQQVHTETGAVATGTTVIPLDDTIPQSNEGDQYMSLAITPTNASNLLRIEVVSHSGNTAGSTFNTTALFQDSGTDAIAVGNQYVATATALNEVHFIHWMTAGTTSSTTFKVRVGGHQSGTTTFNGTAGARKWGGLISSGITITEYQP